MLLDWILALTGGQYVFPLAWRSQEKKEKSREHLSSRARASHEHPTHYQKQNHIWQSSAKKDQTSQKPNPTHPLTQTQVTLNLWTFVMEGWMYSKRLPALTEYKVSTDPSFTASRMEKMLPPHLQWAAQNFNHLHEQPTYFIGTILSLTYLGIGDRATVAAAWGYVGIRIVHSLVHALTNRIMVRFSLFSASSLVLLGLTVRTAAVVFASGPAGRAGVAI
jgi:hypothetical protein